MIYYIFSLTKNNIYYFSSFYIFLMLFFFFDSIININISNFFSYIDIEYTLPKIISNWSNLENNYIILIITNTIIIYLLKKQKYHLNKKFYYLINILIISFLTYITYYNQLYTNKFFFNNLLNHTMGSIHPPLILISIFYIRYIYTKNYKKKEIHFIFIILSLSLLTGAIWSSTLFGWNGLWMWDPIENISFFYWIFILFLIHVKKNKKKFLFMIFFFILDFYFFIVLKIDLIKSIHQFQFDFSTWKINYYPLIFFFFYSSVFLFIYYYIIKKKNILIINKINTNNMYLLLFIILFIYPIEIYNIISLKNTNYILNYYYSFVYLFFFYVWLNYVSKYKNTNYSTILLFIFIIFSNITIIYLIFFIYTFIISSSYKKSKFYILHILYFTIIFFFFFFYWDHTEKRNIEHNSYILYYISDFISISKTSDYIFKSIIENIQTNNMILFNEQNNIALPHQTHYNIIFYKKNSTNVKDDTPLQFFFSFPHIISYSLYLKEITLNLSIFFLLIIICFLLYIYKTIYTKMRFYIIK